MKPGDQFLWLLNRLPGIEEQARQLVARARGGEDFCMLVGKYSDDVDTKDKCGSRGPLPMQAFIAPIPSLGATGCG